MNKKRNLLEIEIKGKDSQNERVNGNQDRDIHVRHIAQLHSLTPDEER